jgi:hypothetical protein
MTIHAMQFALDKVPPTPRIAAYSHAATVCFAPWQELA